MVFLSHIHEEEDVAQYLKDQITHYFLGTIDLFVAGDIRSIELGADWFDKIVKGITDSDIVLILVSNESASRPFINFEAGGAWLSKKKVIPLCYKGMVPESLPQPLRRLQGINLCQKEKLEDLFNQLASEAHISVPPNLPLEEMAQRITKGEIPISETSEEKIKNWFVRPGTHEGEEINVVARKGDFTQCPKNIAEIAKVDPTTSLWSKIHLDAVDYRPFLECVITDKAADIFETVKRDEWINVKAKLIGSYEKVGSAYSLSDTIFLPVIIIENIKKVIATKE